MSAGQLLNWGFNPTGTALGSEGSPSMPEEQQSGLDNPMAVAGEVFSDFVMQTQRRYGEVSDVNGGIWDPRGDAALSEHPSDYKTTDLMRPDEIGVNLNQSDDQLGGGDPVLAPYMPDNSGFAQALYDRDIGLSPQGAATLADSLVVFNPSILEGIKIPPQVEPRITNALGLSTSDGGLPQEFFSPSSGVIKQGMPETIEKVIANSAQYQYVDENGVVDKYAPGTSPYDAVQKGIIAGAPGTPSGAAPTPAQRRAYPKLFKNAASSSSGNGLASANAANQPTGGAANMADAGAPVPVDPEEAVTGSTRAQSAATSSSGSGYSTDSIDYIDAETTIPAEEAAAAKSCSKLWWLLALVPVGAAAYYVSRKGKKRGRR